MSGPSPQSSSGASSRPGPAAADSRASPSAPSPAPSPTPPLRICLWGPLPPPPGGVSQWVLRYQAASPRYGLDVRVINTSPPPVGRHAERSRFRLGRVGVAGRALGQLVDQLRRDRPDVVHLTTTLFWATPREALALALLTAARVPTVLHLHASTQLITWRDGLDPVRRRALDVCLRSASAVLVLSQELERYLAAELPGLHIARIGNLVATSTPTQPSWDTAKTPVFRPSSRMQVLFVGALTPLKGVAELCEAVQQLDGVELVLVGARGDALDPRAGERMNAALAALQATGRLQELGHLPLEDVQRAYESCDVFCLPSHREGMPTVLLEAMAAGLPCVVTPVGAVSEMVAGDAALVVPVGDVSGLAAALGQLASDPEHRAALGRAAAQRMATTYTESAVMNAYRSLYEQLLESPRPS